VRIWGVVIPPGYLQWATTGVGVVVLGVLIAVAANTIGVFGAAPEDQGITVSATVVNGAPCDRADATETVKFTMAGKAHQARYDGCGHAKDEPVEVRVPTGTLPDDLVVHAADAAMGDSEPGEGLGLLLIVVSGTAGATYAYLLRRESRVQT
jgi:hypothetical protein